MPAEWEAHEATWIAWPHAADDWPGKFEAIDWVYVEIVRALALSERVEIVVFDEQAAERALSCLDKNGVRSEKFRMHIRHTDRSWLRDSAPTAVLDRAGALHWVGWHFNGWAKYDNYLADREVPQLFSAVTKAPLIAAKRPDNGRPLILEGGALDVDGEGTLLVTEECLLSELQARNPGLSREGYEQAFCEYLGISKTIWLARGCAGDDTHGHIDDVARFIAPGKIMLAVEENPEDRENYESSRENLSRLDHASDAQGRKVEVVKLPMPRPIFFDGQRVPASYANFYIANRVVLVPTFNDPNDRVALNIISDLFPTREVIGVHSLDLVWGLGTLHCLTQQQPRCAE